MTNFLIIIAMIFIVTKAIASDCKASRAKKAARKASKAARKARASQAGASQAAPKVRCNTRSLSNPKYVAALEEQTWLITHGYRTYGIEYDKNTKSFVVIY